MIEALRGSFTFLLHSYIKAKICGPFKTKFWLKNQVALMQLSFKLTCQLAEQHIPSDPIRTTGGAQGLSAML